MQALRFLHKFVTDALPEVHKVRREALILATSSLVEHGQLTLTALGRNMRGKALVRHKIKKVDRLLSNERLFGERFYIYREISSRLLKNLKSAVILVDWSGCCSQERWILQASLAMSGRSIPLYSEIHPLEKVSNSKVEGDFLKQLRSFFSSKTEVTVVTDAGFKTPWFRAVRELGWHFVGRLRGPMQINLWGSWQNSHIPRRPIFLGQAVVGKIEKSMEAQVYAYQTEYKGRKRMRRKYCRDSYPDRDEKYGRVNKEPWILISSLEEGQRVARNVVNIYRSRVQIEQNFRDLKNQRWGFGLRDSKTEHPERLQILLLIGFIAAVVLWLLGIVAEANKLHYGFQANTKKDRRVLSLINLGWQVVRHGLKGRCTITLKNALREMVLCHLKITA